MIASFFAIAGMVVANVMLIIIMLVLLAQNLVYFIQLWISISVRVRQPSKIGSQRDLWQLQALQSPGVSLIAPAFNEELTIAQSIRSLLSIDYPDFEVIVVNDGSKDETMNVLKAAFCLRPSARHAAHGLAHQPLLAIFESESHPNLLVLDKINGRKADACNAGINFASKPLLCVTDADSILEPDALLRACQPFLSDDGSLLAVGGSIRLTNGSQISAGSLRQTGMPKTFIERFQILEYLRAFMVARIAWSDWQMLTLISGAFGVFRGSAVIAAGGYRHDTVGEDLELAVRIQRLAKERAQRARIEFVPDAICWTEAPATYAGLRNQRSRWQQGALETLHSHRVMLFNPRFGRIGKASMPLILLEDVCVPVAEALGYALLPVFIIFGFTNWLWLCGMLVFSLLMGTGLSIGALFQEEFQTRAVNQPRDIAILIFCAFFENIGYRQFNTYCRLRGIRRHVAKETSWASVPRVGFVNH
ncbi:glycosyltransferase [uncultured Sphingorhabdus sp.]|uniref:glycosyltransferase family 2 protein n=1 Tax=uncultured Sphingorhabdus sp. TaxID=1686106 RepID=UPI0026132BDC|nr:glycosyltransferase [uncultured Sphingorhabdus sp.]HMS20071.1 glycosyltransferase [Sphingorhabdus sp.]